MSPILLIIYYVATFQAFEKVILGYPLDSSKSDLQSQKLLNRRLTKTKQARRERI